MPEPCKQEGPVAAIDERTLSHEKAIQDFRGAFEENNRILNKISEALGNIRHFHEDQERTERAINEIFSRLRAVELAPGRTAGKSFWLLVTCVSGAIGSTISGVVVYLITSN